MKFHEKLYILRRDAGMTQNDLAQELNVSRQAVSRWEMGTSMPDVDNLIAMSDLFGVTLDELLKNSETAPELPTKAEPVFWDFLPSKWWLPLVLAGAAVAADFLWVFFAWMFPEMVNASVSDNPVLWIFGLIFSPIGFVAMARIFPWITVGCVLYALVKWQKAKK